MPSIGNMTILGAAILPIAAPPTQWRAEGVDVRLGSIETRTSAIFHVPFRVDGNYGGGDKHALVALNFQLVPHAGFAITRDSVFTLTNAIDASGEDARVDFPRTYTIDAIDGQLFGTARASDGGASSHKLLCNLRTFPDSLWSIDGHVDVQIANEPKMVVVNLREKVDREIFPGVILQAQATPQTDSINRYSIEFSLSADPAVPHYTIPLIKQRVHANTIAIDSYEEAFKQRDTKRTFADKVTCTAPNQIELEFYGLGPFNSTRVPFSTGPIELWHPGFVPTRDQNLELEFVTLHDDYEMRLYRGEMWAKWTPDGLGNQSIATIAIGLLDVRSPPNRRRYSCDVNMRLREVRETDERAVPVEHVRYNKPFDPNALEFAPPVFTMPNRGSGPTYRVASVSLPFSGSVARRSLKSVAGDIVFQEVTKEATLDVPLEAPSDREMMPGVHVKVSDADNRNRPGGRRPVWRELTITTKGDCSRDLPVTPSINEIAIFNEAGEVVDLVRQFERLQTAEGCVIRVNLRLSDPTARLAKLNIVQETREVSIPFQFENVPLQGR